MLRTPLLLVLCLGGLMAQSKGTPPTPNESTPKKIDPRCFMVHDYTNVVAADFAIMRRLEIWDDFKASALNVAFGLAKKQLGFSLDVVDRFTMTMAFPNQAEQDKGARPTRMSVFAGAAPLPMSASVLATNKSQKHGRHTLYQQEWDEELAYVQPSKNLQAWGDVRVLKAALDGKRGPGLPSSDVMSLSAGRGNRLAYMVADLSNRMARKTFLEDLLAGTEWPADDMPTFLAARVLATGDEDDLHLELEGTLRHAKVGEGLQVSDKAIDALIQRGIAMPQLRMFRKILKNAEKKTSGSDVTVRVDLGRSRHAIGNLAMVMAPLFLMGTEAQARPVRADRAVQVEEVTEEVEIVEPPPPPPPEEPKPGGGGGGLAPAAR